MTREDVRRVIRSFILTNFLPGEEPETLADSTLLLTSGIMTSLSMLELIDFLEEEFSVVFEPEDIGAGRMDTIELLVELVAGKAGIGGAPS